MKRLLDNVLMPAAIIGCAIWGIYWVLAFIVEAVAR